MNKIKFPKFKTSQITSIMINNMQMLIFLLFSILYGLIIFFANFYSHYEPTIVQVNNKIELSKSKNIDDAAINKLKELESRNISIETLFDNGRNNPFEN